MAALTSIRRLGRLRRREVVEYLTQWSKQSAARRALDSSDALPEASVRVRAMRSDRRVSP
jgi:hypothetical protein